MLLLLLLLLMRLMRSAKALHVCEGHSVTIDYVQHTKAVIKLGVCTCRGRRGGDKEAKHCSSMVLLI